MRFKKWAALWLAILLTLSLGACGQDTPTGSTATTVLFDSTTTVADSTTVPTNATTDTFTAPADTTTAPTEATTQGSVTTTPATTTTTAPSADVAVLEEAFALGVGQQLPGEVTLTGTITAIKEVSDQYQNATFTLTVQGKDLLCYRVKPATGTPLTVTMGDRLTLTGTIQNYKGTIEFYPAVYVNLSAGGTTAKPTTRPTYSGDVPAEDGIYDSKEDVALYIVTYGKLPKNYVTKAQYSDMGEPRDKCCGGDRFYNKERRLPQGYTYYECDIDTYGSSSRGAKRLVYTKSGIVYYTSDHYRSFTLLYGSP